VVSDDKAKGVGGTTGDVISEDSVRSGASHRERADADQGKKFFDLNFARSTVGTRELFSPKRQNF